MEFELHLLAFNASLAADGRVTFILNANPCT